MPGNLLILPKQVPIVLGTTVPSAKLYTYETGTSTPQAVYQDIDLTTAHSNPVQADSAGVFAPIYLDGSLPNYRLKLTDSDGTQIYQLDGIPSANKAAADAFTVSGGAPYVDLIEDDASTNAGS